jgi:hypothetical protein
MRCLNAGTLRASEARHIIAHMAYVAAAAQEKEAGCKMLPVVVFARNCPRDGQLARACQAAEPEDAPLVLPVRPAIYFAKKVDARIGEAGGLVLLAVRVEGRVFGVR